MKLPSKVTPFNKSVLSKLSVVLVNLQESELTPYDLYLKTKNSFVDVVEFLDAIDCLLLLGKITYSRKGRLRYVI